MGGWWGGGGEWGGVGRVEEVSGLGLEGGNGRMERGLG